MASVQAEFAFSVHAVHKIISTRTCSDPTFRKDGARLCDKARTLNVELLKGSEIYRHRPNGSH